MNTLLQFFTDNWASISAVVLWLAARLIPTKKNYDAVEMVLNLLGKLVPNNRTDSLGNPKK